MTNRSLLWPAYFPRCRRDCDFQTDTDGSALQHAHGRTFRHTHSSAGDEPAKLTACNPVIEGTTECWQKCKLVLDYLWKKKYYIIYVTMYKDFYL